LSAAILVTGKFRKKRWVYWKHEQADSLSKWVKVRPASKSPALFLTQSRKQFTDNGFTSTIRQIRTKAGVLKNNTNPHAFRHAFAQRKLDEGHDLAYVSQWLGHSSPEFTAKVYCIRTEDMLRKQFFTEPNRTTK
jgi:site-specific recombinase XerD